MYNKGYTRYKNAQSRYLLYLVAGNDPTDCAAILGRNPAADSGVYTIRLFGKYHSVYCDMGTDLGGWTVRTSFTSWLLILILIYSNILPQLALNRLGTTTRVDL